MTLELADGRGELFQWDAGRIIEFGDDTVSQAHFTSIEKITDIPYTIEVKNRKAAIPDELLQVPGTLIVYAWVSDTNGGYTKVQVNFPVFARPKPSDYVYTPTEHAGFDKLRAEIGDLADLTTEAKDTLVAAINEVARSSGSESMSLRVADGYIQYSTDSGSTWTNLIAVAELKGDTGAAGAPGKDGHSPVVTATKSGKTTTISVDGSAIATVEDGADGKPGAAGAPGKDGAGMDITGATVGQIAKITAVDASGVPTAWSPADIPSGGSPDAVLYTAQTLTGAQQKQARENIEAADRVFPVITGTVSLLPENSTDILDAVRVTVAKASAEDFTVTLDGRWGSTLVHVDGIRTPTHDDIYSAVNVEFVLHASYIVVENNQVTEYNYSEINEEFERGTLNIWLEPGDQDIRLASYKLMSDGSFKLIFIDSSDGAGIEVHSVTVSESTAEYAVTSMANGNGVSY